MRVLLHMMWGLKPGFVGGTERFVINLAKGIQKKGSEAIIVCSNLESKTEIEGVEVLGVVPNRYKNAVKRYGCVNENFIREEILKSNTNALVNFSEYVSDQIGNMKFDIAHFNSFVHVAFLNSGINLQRCVATNHDNDLEMDHYWGDSFYRNFKQSIRRDKSVLPKLGHLTTCSDYYANFLSQELNLPISAIHLGIDSSIFYPVEKNHSLRGKYCDSDTLLILMSARFDTVQKGHDIALESIAILKQRGIRTKIICSGFDSETYAHNKRDFDLLTKNLGLEDSVELTKFESIKDAYSIADLVISPERFCSYGLSISESLAMGLHTVLSPIPTYLEIASGYKHAHFAENMNPISFADIICNLKYSGIEPDIKEAKRFITEHSFNKCVDAYFNLYDDLMSKR